MNKSVITVTSEQYNVMRDYIELCSIESRFTLRYDDFNSEAISEQLQNTLIDLNSYLKSILSAKQYEAFKDAEIECDDNEELTLIDFETFSKYIDIVVE